MSETIIAGSALSGGADTSTPRVSEPEYLDTTEAAALLRLSPRTLERMRVEGCGPPYLKAGRGIRAKVLYKPDQVRAWVEALSYGSTSEYKRGDRDE